MSAKKVVVELEIMRTHYSITLYIGALKALVRAVGIDRLVN